MIKVLLVDDEPFVRIGIKSAAEWDKNGFSIIGDVSNGKQALDLIEREKPEIVFTDIKMPVMNGIELIKELHGRKYPILIVVLSCYGDIEYVKEAIKYGAYDYLIKNEITPAKMMALLETLKDEIAKKSNFAKINLSQPVINDNISLIKHSYLVELIKGDEPDLSNIKIDFGTFVIIYIVVDDYLEVKTKYDSRIMNTTLKNLVKELLLNNGDLIDFRDKELTIIFNSDKNVSEAVIMEKAGEFSNALHAAAKNCLNVSVSIGISNLCNNVSKIKYSFLQAKQAAELRFFLGKGRITNYKEILYKDFEFEDYYKYLNNVICKVSIDEIEFEKIYPSDIIKDTGMYSEENIRKLFFNIAVKLMGKVDLESYQEININDEINEKETILELGNWLKEFFHRLITMNNRLHYKTYDIVQNAIEYINNNYKDDISLTCIASHINVNPSYLSRIFKKKQEMNIVDYIKQVRIEKAKKFLAKNYLKINQVAELVGFKNYAYFSKVFKDETGQYPKDYKLKNR